MSWRFLLFGFFILFSCIDDSDYRLDELQVSPSLALPLANGDLTIHDLLSDEDTANIKIYPDGLIYLAYEQELQSQGIRELFTIPDKSVSRSFLLPGATLPPFNKDIRTDSLTFLLDLGLSPEQLDEIALKSGLLEYATSIAPSTSNLDYEIQVSIPEVKSRANNKPIGIAAKGSGSTDLGNYTMFLNDNKFQIKLVLVIKAHNSPINISAGTSINIKLTFRSLDFNTIKGFFGTQSVDLPAQTIDVGAFQTSFGDADVSLADPKISLTVRNDYGVPCLIDFTQLVAKKPGASIAVQLSPANPVPLNAPATIGNSAFTTVSITNVNEVLEFGPSQFNYAATARINEGQTNGSNFLADTSKMSVKMNIEVPLYGHASNIILKDTVDLDWSDVDQSQIESASLRLKLVNELPLDGALQLVLTDDNYAVIETLLAAEQTNIIKGSSVNASGELVSAGVYDSSIELALEKIKKIFEARHLILLANLSTSKDSGGNLPDVKFKSNYTLSINAGMQAKLKLNVKL